MSLGLRSSGKIDQWVTKLTRAHVFDMRDDDTRRLVLFSSILGRPAESGVFPHVREYFLQDELSPIAMLRPTDAVRDVFEWVDDNGVGVYVTALTRYDDALKRLGVASTPMYAAMQGVAELRQRFYALRLEVADSYANIRASHPLRVEADEDQVMGMYSHADDTLYLFQQSLGRMSGVVDGFVFTLLHELAHVIDPCAEEQTLAVRQGRKLDSELVQVVSHCTRYRFVLLALCEGLGLLRGEIYRAAKSALGRDTTFGGVTYKEIDAWETAFTSAPPATERFRLRSEVMQIPRGRFVRGLARTNYADAEVMDIEDVVAVDGVYNLFDTDPEMYPLDVLNTFCEHGVVLEEPVQVSGDAYGLYMKFLDDPGVFAYIYTTPRGDSYTLNCAEAYWILN